MPPRTEQAAASGRHFASLWRPHQTVFCMSTCFHATFCRFLPLRSSSRRQVGACAHAPQPRLLNVSRPTALIITNFHAAGFSEYASYISWVRAHYPGSQRLAKRQTWSRYGPGGWDEIKKAAIASPNKLCCPKDEDIEVRHVPLSERNRQMH